MKKLFVLAFALFAYGMNAQTAVGGGISLGSGYTALNLKGEFGITENIGISPSVDYVLGMPSGSSLFAINADGHYYLGDPDAFNYYPLAGLGMWIYSVSAGGYSASGSAFLFNLGGGGTYALSDSMKLFGEAKFVLGGYGYGGGTPLLLTFGVMFNL